LRDSLPIDMLLSALSFLVVAQSSSEVSEGLMNNPVLSLGHTTTISCKISQQLEECIIKSCCWRKK